MLAERALNFSLFSASASNGSLSDKIAVDFFRTDFTLGRLIGVVIQGLAVVIVSASSRFSKLNQPATNKAPPTGTLIVSR